MNIRSFIRQALHETLGQADKVYFKPGKLSQRVKDVILKITGGDAFTKIITDIYWAELQASVKTGKWAVSVIDDGPEYEINHDEDEEINTSDNNDVLDIEKWKEIKSYYQQLKEYNKNVFPISTFNINGVKNIWELIKSLKSRAKILEQMKKMPSVALRNMREEIRIPRSSQELQEYNNKLEYFFAHYLLLNNKNEKIRKSIEKKMFKQNITLKDLLHFVEEKENLLGNYKFTKNSIKKIVAENDYDLEIVYEKENIMVINVMSAEGIKEIGCNSLWCFTYGNGFEAAYEDWNKYSTNGHVYVIIDFLEDSDSPDFMHVLVKPLDYNSIVDPNNGDMQNAAKLYDSSNQFSEDPLSIIDHLVGLQNAPNIFHFDLPYAGKNSNLEKNIGTNSNWPYEDPNQLKLDLKEIRTIIRKKLLEQLESRPGLIHINNETFYHQTGQAQAQSILDNGFHVHMHDGQARFTHGVYFLNHSEGNFGETTLSAKVSGNFIDFTNDDMGDGWLALKNSYNWNNYVDLTLAIQKDFPDADGIIFNNKYMLVVWYPEKCITDIKISS